MSIESAADLAGMQRAGRTVALILQEMTAAARVGMTTAELDSIGAAAMKRYGARSAPQFTYGFPGFTCISVNDEIVHGVPADRRLRSGDSPWLAQVSVCQRSAARSKIGSAETGSQSYENCAVMVSGGRFTNRRTCRTTRTGFRMTC